ncbi:MAG: hypothetical protein AVDCRST_MAG43-1824 [uncultured Thermomicrobiales bacterium]|uniref:SH3b domain-containing protein n=1 Tax=uncultured Thermomicrobiales bacterium TaxID=1645740 RepID=A0A6J4V073_9BACT|nr:MAG: hypothetical protein AVDCRST_MAG43-1824 [uncultured Thermomicrobiales bacterium]
MQTAGTHQRSLKGSRANVHAAQAASDATDIVAMGEQFAVGPWRLTVAEVRTGAEAAAQVQEANAYNAAAPDGLGYLTARVTAESMSDRPLVINLSDFAATGADGVLRRPPTIDMPEPALQGVVEPGKSLEGWIPLLVDDPAPATLWFDSPFTGGNWADAIFALSETAAMPSAPTGNASDTDAGADPSRPVAIGETVRTGGWDVTVEEVIFDQQVIDLADFRLQALGLDGVLPGGSMIGVRLSVTNRCPYPAFFSTSALAIADPGGDPWDHTITLTPPNPDVSQEYLPGGSGNGWAAFEIADFASADLIRILPFHINGSPRYVSFTGGVSAAEADTDYATAVPQNLAEGDTVVIAEASVNLRAEPSATGEIVAELTNGTELEITGDAQEADGYVWYPVEVTGTGETGFVAQDFITPGE